MKNKLHYLIAKTVCICLVAVLLFATGCSKKEDAGQTTQPEETASADVAATTPDAPQETTAPAVESTEATQPGETTPQPQAPSTTEEIVAYFNESANKIKTQAVSVTKNFEKRHVNKDRLVVPAGLESTADNMSSMVG